MTIFMLWLLQMELKDHIIGLYREQLYESEAQRRSAQIKHLSMLDASIDIHYLRTAVIPLILNSYISSSIWRSTSLVINILSWIWENNYFSTSLLFFLIRFS